MPSRAKQQEPEPEEQVPPFYVATAPLPFGGRDAFPTYAFQTGDRVPPELVGPNNWGDRVEVPEQFRGVLAPPPTPEPEPGSGDKEE
jgi:hypothetical protein